MKEALLALALALFLLFELIKLRQRSMMRAKRKKLLIHRSMRRLVCAIIAMLPYHNFPFAEPASL